MSRALLRTIAPYALIAGGVAVPHMATSSDGLVVSTGNKGTPIGTQWTKLAPFDVVTATSRDDIQIRTGSEWQIRAIGDARAIARLRYDTEGNVLTIGRTSQRRGDYGNVRIEIVTPSLHSATVAGSGTLSVDRLEGKNASLTIAGSGDARVAEVASDTLEATMAGSGDLVIAGKVHRAQITLAGSGELQGDNLNSETAELTIAGSGTARFHAVGPVSATVVGSGNAFVTGTQDCSQTHLGPGRLVCTK